MDYMKFEKAMDRAGKALFSDCDTERCMKILQTIIIKFESVRYSSAYCLHDRITDSFLEENVARSVFRCLLQSVPRLRNVLLVSQGATVPVPQYQYTYRWLGFGLARVR
jgi:hypothetical protein